ncbi:MAG: zinc ribbon domain-containing protein [Deltaproteobacteria bacterium]|nr:zinc ribbon domain-containing protein [Deltaproteobacteria bacterium]
MPIYEYKCEKCGKEFETLVLNQKEAISCPDCGFDRCAKLLSSFRSLSGSRGSSEAFESRSSSGSGCGSCAATSCAGCGSR